MADTFITGDHNRLLNLGENFIILENRPDVPGQNPSVLLPDVLRIYQGNSIGKAVGT